METFRAIVFDNSERLHYIYLTRAIALNVPPDEVLRHLMRRLNHNAGDLVQLSITIELVYFRDAKVVREVARIPARKLANDLQQTLPIVRLKMTCNANATVKLNFPFNTGLTMTIVSR